VFNAKHKNFNARSRIFDISNNPILKAFLFIRKKGGFVWLKRVKSQNYRYHAFFGVEPLRGVFKNNGQSRRAKNAALE